MPTRADLDADFYAIVHSVLQASAERAAEERRALRESFDGAQLIAPYHEGQLPNPNDFRKVRCQDLSLEGISYFDSQPPAHERFLLRLGSNPVVCLIGEVEHHTEVTGHDEPEYLVCCKFIGRVALD